MDPFVFLIQSVEKQVHVCTVNNEVVAGTLLAVDDHCNVMLQNWVVMQKDGKEASNMTSLGTPVRFIRGAQIRTIALVR
ncbi:LSM domain [Trypanosoma melophagium]|uniref:LSM domain n=1 Tax=Trypanosoma melophagium TaxID=715481 RepID=UPI00351A74A4|nr:LSM domain [Trypanosoma melophagium]